MAEELSIEMQTVAKKKPFWLSPKGIALCACLALILLAAIFSWWLANGTVSSIQAKMDTMVYTVEPEFPGRVRNVIAQLGQDVQSGQVIGTMEVTEAYVPQNQQSGLQGITDRLSATQAAEKQLATRVSEARAEEERLYRIYQDSVTEHVRAQLAMRALNQRNHGAYQQAQAAELAAKSRMQAANDEFERASKARAAMDVELNKIRAQIQRARRALTPGMVESALSGQAPMAKVVDLYAPVTGKVIRVNADLGHPVHKGQDLFTILPTGDDYLTASWIQAWFPTAARKHLEVGQEALIRFENGLQLKGKVKSVGGSGEKMSSASDKRNSSNYVDVKIVLDDPFKAQNIQPGAKAECQVQTRYLLGLTFF